MARYLQVNRQVLFPFCFVTFFVTDKQRFSQYKIKGRLVVGNNVSRIEVWQRKRVIRF